MRWFAVRTMREADTEAVTALWQELQQAHAGAASAATAVPGGAEAFACHLESLRKRAEVGTVRLLVAEGDGRVAGYAIAYATEAPSFLDVARVGVLWQVAVTAEHRLRGVGWALYEEARAWFAEQGLARIELGVASTNEPSLANWFRIAHRLAGARERFGIGPQTETALPPPVHEPLPERVLTACWESYT